VILPMCRTPLCWPSGHDFSRPVSLHWPLTRLHVELDESPAQDSTLES